MVNQSSQYAFANLVTTVAVEVGIVCQSLRLSGKCTCRIVHKCFNGFFRSPRFIHGFTHGIQVQNHHIMLFSCLTNCFRIIFQCIDNLSIIIKSTAVTGVQPKLSLNLSSGDKKSDPKRFTIVGLWGNFILKPPTTRYPEIPEVEDLTMHLAKIARINVVPHSLIRLKSGQLAYITKRIDRIGKSKQHMEDMCQLQERMTEDKYRGSVEQIGKIIEKHSSNSGYDLQRLFEMVVFSFLTGNADMHLKNYSLFYRLPDFRELAPAYDLLNTAIVIPSDKEESALTINGKKSKLKKSDFDHLAKNLQLIQKVKESIIDRIISSLSQSSKIIQNSFLNEEMKEKYMNTISSKINQISL